MGNELSRIYRSIAMIAHKEAKRLQPKSVWATVDGSAKDGVVEARIDGNEEVTECTAMVSTHAGDRVMVSIDPETGTPTVIGNYTNPAVDDASFKETKDIAESANKLLDIVSDAADKAETTVEQIFINASEAGQGVEEIKNYVGMAEGYTETLTQRVEQSEQSLNAIKGDAADAKSAAERAAASAVDANLAASRAESGLARVQDVVGTVTWLEEHAGPTGDEVAQVGKDYYIHDEATGTLTQADVQPGQSVAGLWELTESVRDYIASYLALVNGVLRLSNGGTARVELSSKALRFYSENNTVVASIAVTDDDVSYLSVRKMKIERGMYFDQWRMFRRRNGNLALKWNKLFE